MGSLRRICVVWLALFCSGCASVSGVANSNTHRDLPRSATFATVLVDGDPVVGKKIERMLQHQLAARGYEFTDKAPQLLVSFAFDVMPAGSVSRARTTVNHEPVQGRISSSGDRVTLDASRSTATTYIDTTRLYRKTIAARITDLKTGAKLWDGVVSETGWCNQIFVTAPHILSLMFYEFPREMTNVRRSVNNADSNTKEIKALFPSDTNWGCRKT